MTDPGHREFDVVVIGAGVAGLAAARALVGSGRQVAILEATHRVGGRVYSDRLPRSYTGAAAAELGAEFVHGRPETTWRLLVEAGLEAQELAGTYLNFRHGSLSSEEPNPDGATGVLEQMASWLETQPEGTDETFAKYLGHIEVSAAIATRASSYVEGFNAADARRIGIAGLARQQRAEDAIESERLFRVTAGYSAVPDYLAQRYQAAGGRLLQDHVVQKVRWGSHDVKVSGAGPGGARFELAATRAVITLPLGVLQANAVQFLPEPADLLHHASKLAFGHAIRISLLFESGFWPEDLSFLFAPEETLPTWWTPNPARVPLITGWVGGTRASQLAERQAPDPTAALARDALTSLARILQIPPARLQSALVSYHTHDWAHDPRCLGAYSYVPAGVLDAAYQLTRPVHDTLFFAGEHTDTAGHWGTVHGALASGMRAAGQILSSAPDTASR